MTLTHFPCYNYLSPHFHFTWYFNSVFITPPNLYFSYSPNISTSTISLPTQKGNTIYVCSLVNLLTFKHSCVSLRGHGLWRKHFHWFNFSCKEEKGGVSPKQFTYTVGGRKTLHSTFLWYHLVFNFLQQKAMILWKIQREVK